METTAAIAARRSIRRFRPWPVADDLLVEVLGAAAKAPSGGNRQPWSFLVLSGEPKDLLIEQVAGQAERLASIGLDGAGFRRTLLSLTEAPIVVLVFNTQHQPLPRLLPHWEYLRVVDIQSIGAAVQNMILRATDLEVGSLWAGFVVAAEEEIRKQPGRPEELVTAVALGYPAEAPEPRPRRHLEELVQWLGDRQSDLARPGEAAAMSPVAP